MTSLLPNPSEPGGVSPRARLTYSDLTAVGERHLTTPARNAMTVIHGVAHSLL